MTEVYQVVVCELYDILKSVVIYSFVIYKHGPITGTITVFTGMGLSFWLVLWLLLDRI